jgi:hypothetical protein
MAEKVIRFQGTEYLLIGDLEKGGPIATREQYESGACSYAHLQPDGTVMRFRDSIGHRDEIEVIGECEVDIKASLVGMLTDESWPWNRP